MDTEDQLLTNAFDIASKDNKIPKYINERDISEETWSQYLNTINNLNFKSIASKIKEFTMYVDWYTLISKLESVLKLFSTYIGDEPFKVFINKYKFDSTSLLIIKIWSYIKKLNFQGFVDIKSIYKPSQSYNILLIDDCCYTGHTICSYCDELCYDNKQSDFNFYICVPYCSQGAISQIKNIKTYHSNFKVKIFRDTIIKPLSSIYTNDNILFEGYQFDNPFLIPIYFDHKVAGYCSTFYQVYMEGQNMNKDKDYGMLLPHQPDLEIKDYFHDKYFPSMKPPHNDNYIPDIKF